MTEPDFGAFGNAALERYESDQAEYAAYQLEQFVGVRNAAEDALLAAFGEDTPEHHWEPCGVSSWAKTTIGPLVFYARPGAFSGDPYRIYWHRPTDNEDLEVDSVKRLGELLSYHHRHLSTSNA